MGKKVFSKVMSRHILTKGILLYMVKMGRNYDIGICHPSQSTFLIPFRSHFSILPLPFGGGSKHAVFSTEPHPYMSPSSPFACPPDRYHLPPPTPFKKCLSPHLLDHVPTPTPHHSCCTTLQSRCKIKCIPHRITIGHLMCFPR